MRKKDKGFWLVLVIFSLMGQIAWVVENMYFNVFIYKMFRASASDISLMVALSAITATVTTLLIGALSDKVGKRKIFICGGYVLWGVSILSFCFLRMDILQGITGSMVQAASLGVTLVIFLDCLMTFFGSSANDAAFNAWLTDIGDETNRGTIEGINAMMPLISILVVFGGFMAFDLDASSSWTLIFLIIGISVFAVGILGFFLIKDTAVVRKENKKYFANIIYSFRPSVMKENKLLYAVIGAFAVFGISIQTFMPYLILYYEKGLGMSNYVLIMAPAIILAAVVTAVYGKLYDQLGFKRCVYPAIFILMTGYILLYFFRNTILVFVGSLFMMIGYLSGMAVFGAKIRDNTPQDKTGLFQGLRIFGQVFVPGIIGPSVGAFVLRNAEMVTNSDGTKSFLPNSNVFLAAFVSAALLLIVLNRIFKMVREGHRELYTDFGKTGKPDAGKSYTGESYTDVPDTDAFHAVPFSEYPRPQMKRDSYYCLNGMWENGIVVPYPPESILSRYGKRTGKNLIYRRKFTLPEGFMKDRLLLHFGAVDQIAKVYVNGKEAGCHAGGYEPFCLDITEFYQSGANTLEVHTEDTLSQDYPYGKQRKKRGEMWYTPISGIWQSVWLESVPYRYIRHIRITPDLTGVELEIHVEASLKGNLGSASENSTVENSASENSAEILAKEQEAEIVIHTPEGDKKVIYGGKPVRIDLEELGCKPCLWTPVTPYLYRFLITAGEDEVESYFALRTIDIREVNGQNRICLNGEPVFLHGVLDQGYFSDGIYLPASEKGYEFDIRAMKELGFNTLRKHIKTEPECFYYLCDKLGMLVMQDMVNSGKYSFIRDTAMPTIGEKDKKDTGMRVSKARRENFITHMKDTAERLYNHPCVIYYTIFNEGWGQFDSDEMYERLKSIDDTRIVDSASGWFRNEKSDVESSHIYFRSIVLPKTKRPHILSEFGGYSYVVKEHSYSLYNQHGYGFCKDKEELTDQIIKAYNEMVLPSIDNGLCGSVYTQLSDVEDEVNGLYTYDRKVCKVNKERMRRLGGTIQCRLY